MKSENIEINNEGTGGHGVTAEVSSVKGKTVESIESQETQGLFINLSSKRFIQQCQRANHVRERFLAGKPLPPHIGRTHR